MLYVRNSEYFIRDAPATTGANVRTIGTKRARMMVIGPCFSKKACDSSMYFFLKNRASSCLNRAVPPLLPMKKPTWSPRIAAIGISHQQHPERGERFDLRRLRRRDQSRGEEERVAGQQGEQQSRLDEDDQKQSDEHPRAEGVQEVHGIEESRQQRQVRSRNPMLPAQSRRPAYRRIPRLSEYCRSWSFRRSWTCRIGVPRQPRRRTLPVLPYC